jgi:hypothetical protein
MGGGNIENYHFVVSNVKAAQHIERIVLTGDNSTQTWAWPCSNNWVLRANDLGMGTGRFLLLLYFPFVFTQRCSLYDYSAVQGMTVVP